MVDLIECFGEKCNNKTNMLCNRCRRGYYCSKECQVNDWKNHKAFCFYKLSDCLLNVFKLYNENKHKYPVTCLSFSDPKPLWFIEQYNQTRLLRKENLIFFSHTNLFCIICEKYIYDLGYSNVSFIKDGKTVRYIRCIKCATYNDILCEKTFMGKKKCHVYKFICMSHYLYQYEKLNRDVVMYIKILFAKYNTRCCL